jgi:predicted metal-dependent RNase
LLTKYALNVRDTVKKVFLVHGEEKPAMMLTEKLQEKRMREVYYPELHSSVEL